MLIGNFVTGPLDFTNVDFTACRIPGSADTYNNQYPHVEYASSGGQARFTPDAPPAPQSGVTSNASVHFFPSNLHVQCTAGGAGSPKPWHNQYTIDWPGEGTTGAFTFDTGNLNRDPDPGETQFSYRTATALGPDTVVTITRVRGTINGNNAIIRSEHRMPFPGNPNNAYPGELHHQIWIGTAATWPLTTGAPDIEYTSSVDMQCMGDCSQIPAP